MEITVSQIIIVCVSVLLAIAAVVLYIMYAKSNTRTIQSQGNRNRGNPPPLPPDPPARRWPAWIKSFSNWGFRLLAWLVGIALTIFVIFASWYGAKEKFSDSPEEKPVSIEHRTYQETTLKFTYEESAQFTFIAPPGSEILFNKFPANGIIMNTSGDTTRIGPDYGYKVPNTNENVYWKCISMGNPFEVTIYTSRNP